MQGGEGARARGAMRAPSSCLAVSSSPWAASGAANRPWEGVLAVGEAASWRENQAPMALGATAACPSPEW